MSISEKPRVFHIFLGKGRRFFRECMDQSIIKLDYHTVPDDICRKGDWDAVQEHYRTNEGRNNYTLSRHTDILRYFYESTSADVWITHHKGEFWWCRVKPKVTPLDGGFRSRKVIGQWSNLDVNGIILYFQDIVPERVRKSTDRYTIREYDADEANYWRKTLLGQ